MQQDRDGNARYRQESNQDDGNPGSDSAPRGAFLVPV